MFRTAVLASCLFTVAAPVAAATSPNLIVNGNFEHAGSSDTVPTGWTLVNGGDPLNMLRLDGNFHAQYGAHGTQAQLDNHFLAFSAYDSSVNPDVFGWLSPPYLEQSFATVPGVNYVLSYDIAAFGAYSQYSTVYVFDVVNNVLRNQFGDQSVTNPTTNLGAFTRKHDSFIGTGYTMTVRFFSHGPTTSSDLFLDNVSVLPVGTPALVPEPATWGMLITGFGLVGGAQRRRMMKVVTA